MMGVYHAKTRSRPAAPTGRGSSSKPLCESVDDRQGEKGAIDAVEEAAVPREESAAVFDAGSALDGGLREIPDLTCHIDRYREADRLRNRDAGEEPHQIAARDQQRSEHRAGKSLPGLLGTHAPGQFVA